MTEYKKTAGINLCEVIKSSRLKKQQQLYIVQQKNSAKTNIYNKKGVKKNKMN